MFFGFISGCRFNPKMGFPVLTGSGGRLETLGGQRCTKISAQKCKVFHTLELTSNRIRHPELRE